MSSTEVAPSEKIEAMRVHNAFERVGHPEPFVHNPAVFDLLSHVPGLQILNKPLLKQRVSKTFTSKKDHVTARLDPESQDDYQLVAEIYPQDSAHVLMFRYKRNPTKAGGTEVCYSRVYDAENGTITKVVIDQAGTKKRAAVFIESDDEYAVRSVGGRASEPIRPLEPEQLGRLMTVMMSGEEPVLPDVLYQSG